MKLKDWLDNGYTVEQQNNLKILNCSAEGITSLEGIEKLVNLEKLDCSYNELSSLKGIEGLVNLRYLYCSYNELSSLKGIENIDKLKYLTCHTNPLPYSDLYNFSKIKLEVIKEVRQDKIRKLLKS